MDESTEEYIRTQVERISRSMEVNQMLMQRAPSSNAVMDGWEPAARGSWFERIPNWFIAIGLISGAFSVGVAAALFLLDLHQAVAACHRVAM